MKLPPPPPGGLPTPSRPPPADQTRNQTSCLQACRSPTHAHASNHVLYAACVYGRLVASGDWGDRTLEGTGMLGKPKLAC